MLAAVDLNHQLRRTRDEIADERPDYDLTIEPHSTGPAVSEGIPQFPFGRGGVVPQFTGSEGGEEVVGFIGRPAG